MPSSCLRQWVYTYPHRCLYNPHQCRSGLCSPSVWRYGKYHHRLEIMWRIPLSAWRLMWAVLASSVSATLPSFFRVFLPNNLIHVITEWGVAYAFTETALEQLKYTDSVVIKSGAHLSLSCFGTMFYDTLPGRSIIMWINLLKTCCKNDYHVLTEVTPGECYQWW